MKRLRSRLAILGFLAFVSLLVWGPDLVWDWQDTRQLDVVVLDYTVPFENYREHAGAHWLLNHLKVQAPSGSEWSDRDYVGYHPDDREHPTRLSEVNLSGVDLVTITDVYGVYVDDLIEPQLQQAHNDYSEVIFGGLLEADAHALQEHVRRGGTVIAEFNTLAHPTSGAARRIVGDLLGVEWSGWVGRVFVDPHDEGDVPAWLPRNWAEQNDGAELPHEPSLVLVGEDGTLAIFSGPTVDDVLPRVRLTAEGEARFPDARSGKPMHYWFTLVRADQDSHVHAEYDMPDRPGLMTWLEAHDLKASPPVLTEHQNGQSWHMAAEFVDLDFAPGRFDRWGTITWRRWFPDDEVGISAPAYWGFYAPVTAQLIRELDAEHQAP